ncbi:vacuolar fusion protein ccz1 [Dispira parvispora]|uniref:Vacuolar fusion protein ccz1 n=1 Tax=Dispira parvispora TaxID=1520584 RepID=A0A9W8AW05_9FUNG|nr:vacuolar fusion protein ccz1 [Dispira parvispora]
MAPVGLPTVGPTLSFFTVFNPSLGPDEDTEHEQLLFYAASSSPDCRTQATTSTLQPRPPSPTEGPSTTHLTSLDSDVHSNHMSEGQDPDSSSDSKDSQGWGRYLWNGVKVGMFLGSGTSGASALAADSPLDMDPSSHSPPLTALAGQAGQKLIYPFALGSENNLESERGSPTAVPLDHKIRRVGLLQGLVKYTSTFTLDDPWHSVRTEKMRIIIYRPEPNFWLALGVNLGYTVDTSANGDTPVLRYHTGQVSDDELAALVIHSYQTYCLLFGDLTTQLDQPGPQHRRLRTLRRRLEEYYGDLIWQWDFSNMYVYQALRGLPAHPLTKLTLVELQALVQDLAEGEPDGATPVVMVLRHQQLLWATGLEADDVYTLFWYLVANYGQFYLDTCEDSSNKTGYSASPWYSLGSFTLRRKASTVKLPSVDPVSFKKSDVRLLVSSTSEAHASQPREGTGLVHLGEHHTAHTCTLAVYQRELLFCVLYPFSNQRSDPLPSQTPTTNTASPDSQLPPTNIKHTIETVSKEVSRSAHDDWQHAQTLLAKVAFRGFRFVHMNYTSLALHTSWLEPFKPYMGEGTSGKPPSSLLRQYIRNLHMQFERQPDLSQTVVCTLQHGWVAGLRNNDAEMFVMVHKAGAHLSSVEDYLHRLTTHFINNVLLPDTNS